MTLRTPLLMTLLLACDPVGAEVGGSDSELEDFDEGSLPGAGGDEDGSGQGGGDDGFGTGGDDGGADAGEEALTLSSGTWVVDKVSIDDDPCDWDGVLTNYFGIAITDLLPKEFDVEAEAGAFSIKATDYGAAGYIDCDIEDEEFSCETQEVSPETYSLGSFGWLYEVRFSGEATDEDRIEGEAVVSFPGLDSETERTLEYYDIDPDDCTQTFALALERD